jgi:hypothetical protein
LRQPNALNELYIDERLDRESEAVEIYMKDRLNIDSEIYFFNIEDTDDNLVFVKDSIEYYQLFTIDYAVEIIKSFRFSDEVSNKEIAQRLIEYCINDA